MKIVKIVFLLSCSVLVFGAISLLHKRRQVERADVAICGPIVMADGIGRQTVELARVLAKRHSVQIESCHVDRTDVPGDVRRILKKKFSGPARVVIVEEHLWSPGDRLDRFFSDVDGGDQIRYAYSMLESTRIIPEWVMMLNLYFDAVIVPDPFLVDAYVKSGVTVPVFCVPLAIDMGDFLRAPLRKRGAGPMVFASLGNGIGRKNHKLVIQAFAQALGNREDAVLYVNCRQSVPEVRAEIIAEVGRLGCSNIKFTEVSLRKDAYLKFLCSVDCLVNCSKGEGFSIQPREAMALGIPVIVTDNTAQRTICKSGLARVVEASIAEPCYYYGRELSDGEQFNCSVNDCAAAMLDMFENYDVYAGKGALMREWAAGYDFGNLGSRYESLVDPKSVVLGDVNEISAEGVTTNSMALYEKLVAKKKG